ncbi:hypothetical protein TWF730_006628 [Orbilia blumenaviensis]|uniref:Ribosomal protein L2 n=1 Tax=Orbilia blumenaviensis TaxID=1796055 RepID=A0AAV9VIA3_9PEZI
MRDSNIIPIYIGHHTPFLGFFKPKTNQIVRLGKYNVARCHLPLQRPAQKFRKNPGRSRHFGDSVNNQHTREIRAKVQINKNHGGRGNTGRSSIDSRLGAVAI